MVCGGGKGLDLLAFGDGMVRGGSGRVWGRRKSYRKSETVGALSLLRPTAVICSNTAQPSARRNIRTAVMNQPFIWTANYRLDDSSEAHREGHLAVRF